MMRQVTIQGPPMSKYGGSQNKEIIMVEADRETQVSPTNDLITPDSGSHQYHLLNYNL